MTYEFETTIEIDDIKEECQNRFLKICKKINKNNDKIKIYVEYLLPDFNLIKIVSSDFTNIELTNIINDYKLQDIKEKTMFYFLFDN